jgi:2-methylcitrate dehydratase PrpD
LTLGALAAAAACANLRKLNAEQTAHALGIAAAQAAGIVANSGTMTRAVQVGKAANSSLDD